VLTGSARQAQEAKERSEGAARMKDLDKRRDDLERRRVSVEPRRRSCGGSSKPRRDRRRPCRATARPARGRSGPARRAGRLRQADPTRESAERRRRGRRCAVNASAVPVVETDLRTGSGTCACTSPGSRRSRCARSPT
jgi:hypothetical protein